MGDPRGGEGFWTMVPPSGEAIRGPLSRKFRAASLEVVTWVEVWGISFSGCACLLFRGAVWRRGDPNSVQND